MEFPIFKAHRAKLNVFEADQGLNWFKKNWLRIHLCLFTGSFACMLMFFSGSAIHLLLREQQSIKTLNLSLCSILVIMLIFRRTRVLLAPVMGFYLTALSFNLHLSAEFPRQWERKNIHIEADILGLPKQINNDVRFLVNVRQQFTDEDLQRIVGERLLLSCYRCDFNITQGQRWRFTVSVKRPHGYASPNSFDYEKYLFRHQVVAKGYIKTKESNFLVSSDHSLLQSYRAKIKQKIESTLDESPGRATILALVLGDKSGFKSLEHDLLQKAGLSHLFAISGLHVGLVFAISMLCFKWIFNFVSLLYTKLYEVCPRPKLILLPSLLVAVGYSAMAGFAVSTQRALIMLCLFSILRLNDKEVSLLRVLLLTACVIIIFDPFALLDAGFWLSFSAVFVIAICNLHITKISLVTLQPLLWIGMIPISVSLFGHISLVSPAINLIAVPLFSVVLIPLTLFLTLCLGVFGFGFSSEALHSLAKGYDLIFEYLSVLTDMQFAYVSIPKLSMLSSLIFVLFWLSFASKKYRFANFTLLIFLSSVVLESTEQVRADETLKVTLLDVGQGLSLVIQTSKGISVYDTGPKYRSGFSTAEAVLIPYLKSLRAKQLSTVIVSHADNDHIGGYEDLASHFEISNLITSRVDKLPEARFCLAGTVWQEGLTEFEMISPDEHTPLGSNNQSCVLKIIHQGVSIIVTGDIEKQVERYLVSSDQDLSADIMLVPHQGSKTSSTNDFIDVVNPNLALVAAGYLNHYRHPHPSVKQRYQDRDILFLSTIESGSIEITIDRHGYKVSSYRHSQKKFWHWRP